MNINENGFNQDDFNTAPDGSKIYHHKKADNAGWQPPTQYCVHMDDICAHFDKLFPGRQTNVLHEIVSELVHIDLHIMPPVPGGDFYVVYTTGMSDLPMNVPSELEGAENWRLAEIFMMLPPDWNPSAQADNPDFWVIGLLKFLARMPHEFSTWLSHGHTVPNGPNYAPFVQGSQMGGVVLAGLSDDKSPVVTKDGSKIHLYMVAPISRKETEFKLKNGLDALFDLFDQQKIGTIADIYRSSVV
ncbi:MAG: suppressor of fused domain protein [Defluviitaleaceae bacterium]|nr:suppressor of fused domain protein [Defluviitaleaceae bacterium]